MTKFVRGQRVFLRGIPGQVVDCGGGQAALRDHFQRADIPMSQGVRQIVLDYMSAKGLR